MFEAFDVTGLTIGTFNSVREFIEEFVYTETDHESYLDDMEMECEREGDEEFSPDNYPYEDGVDFYYDCIYDDGVSELINWELLLNEFTFLDGTPCGKEVKDE